ncbi:tryptophan synthase subunit alpha [Kitasatospora sp. NPDC048239]|uniref:tryptophan synthase subunit alpha n=1 Tax=Kitasatospora sp. NPDC048239 TaxID=3364046 RepID=UPI003723C2D4
MPDTTTTPAPATTTTPAAPAPARAFFPPRPDGQPGLALFLNAGDPPAPALTDLILMLDEERLDVLELAVPFPNSATDGPVIRRSAARALAHATTLDTVLAHLAELRPHLRHLRIALLADWSHSLKHHDPAAATTAIAQAGADALLVHALPPRLRPAYREAARAADLPQVTTCYHGSADHVVADAAEHAGAYVYLVAHYGRSGTAPAAGHGALSDTVAALRARTGAPVAVGFGVRDGADVAAVARTGAHAAIVGSAAVARVEQALEQRRDTVADLRAFVRTLRTP